jgi:hypothetical protein
MSIMFPVVVDFDFLWECVVRSFGSEYTVRVDDRTQGGYLDGREVKARPPPPQHKRPEYARHTSHLTSTSPLVAQSSGVEDHQAPGAKEVAEDDHWRRAGQRPPQDAPVRLAHLRPTCADGLLALAARDRFPKKKNTRTTRRGNPLAPCRPQGPTSTTPSSASSTPSRSAGRSEARMPRLRSRTIGEGSLALAEQGPRMSVRSVRPAPAWRPPVLRSPEKKTSSRSQRSPSSAAVFVHGAGAHRD